MEIANVKLQLLAQILNIMEARKQVAWNMMGLRLALISKHFIKSNHLQIYKMHIETDKRPMMSNTKQSAACDQRSSCLIHSTLNILQKRGGILLQLPQPLRQESNW